MGSRHIFGAQSIVPCGFPNIKIAKYYFIWHKNWAKRQVPKLVITNGALRLIYVAKGEIQKLQKYLVYMVCMNYIFRKKTEMSLPLKYIRT